MAEYTPTTHEVSEAYKHARQMVSMEGDAEFDRWIAAHDRAVKAEVWDQGVRHAESCPGGLSCDADKANPYRVQGMCESCGVDLRYPTAAHILDCHASMRANSSDGDL